MALLYIDEFENGVVGEAVNSAANSALLAVQGLMENQSFYRIVPGQLSEKCTVISFYVSRASTFWLPIESVESKKITVGCACSVSRNINNLPSGKDIGNTVLLRFSNGTGARLMVNSDGSLSIGSLTTVEGVMVDSVYAYVEVSVNMASGEFELFVNNISVGSGLMTYGLYKNVYFGSDVGTGSEGFKFYDDIYILDDTGTTHNQRLGPVRAVRVPFNSTTEANFTPFGAADNITAINKDSPNDSTFNRSPAANNVGDYFKLDTSVLPSDRPIIAVQQSAMYRKTDIGERALKLVAKEGADRKEHPLPDRLVTFSGGPAQILETAADGSAWDLTNLANTDFGYEVTE